MGRRSKDRGQRPAHADFEFERTLADAEADTAVPNGGGQVGTGDADALCPCGNETFVLEAYMEVTRGRLLPTPVETQSLTCPECAREFEAIITADGRVLRGNFLGYADLGDD